MQNEDDDFLGKVAKSLLLQVCGKEGEEAPVSAEQELIQRLAPPRSGAVRAPPS